MQPSAPRYLDLAGRVAFVTAGTSLLGAMTCRRLAESGVRVAVSGRNEAVLAEVVRSIQDAGGTAIAVAADCTSALDLEQARARTEDAMGPVDIVAAFAGGGSPRPFAQLDESEWRRIVDTNLTATFLTLKAFVPGMVARKRGAVITMSSSAGRTPGLASPAYAAAKAGIVMLTGHLAKELGPDGVRVNCIAPSAIMSSRIASLPAEKQREIAAGFPLGRIGTPEDIADATLFLASESSGWITGVTIDIAGGRVIV